MVNLSQALLYYKRIEIQKAIVESAEDKEISGSFNLEGYSKRPDTLMYPTEILELVKRGITSFHCSEELWYDPKEISSSLKRKELDKLRKGWDLILDIDCKEFEFSKIAGYYLIEALKYQGIKSIYCKFSGNHGFHIGIPFEAFPKEVDTQLVKNLFPEAPRKIAYYLKQMIEPHLRTHLLKDYTVEQIAKLSGKPLNEIMVKEILEPFTFLDIDTILISSRHLYRMPYSFNEKSGLISVPIELKNILTFSKEQAKPENVKVTGIPFLERDIEPNQANQLFLQAFDKIDDSKLIQIYETQYKNKIKTDRIFEELQDAVPQDLFPPCIINILKGLEDGKKRSIFILMNFLNNVGWNIKQIEELLEQWNKNNPEPLKEVYIKGQLNSLRYRTKKILPPNCSNNSYYHDLQICQADNLCGKIKNPVNYTSRKVFAQKQSENVKLGRHKLTDEQKAKRKTYRDRLKAKKQEPK